jgi:hypothetical protein
LQYFEIGIRLGLHRSHFRLLLLQRGELGIALDQRVAHLSDGLVARGERIAHRAQFGSISLRFPLRFLPLGNGRIVQRNFLGQYPVDFLGLALLPLHGCMRRRQIGGKSGDARTRCL